MRRSTLAVIAAALAVLALGTAPSRWARNRATAASGLPSRRPRAARRSTSSTGSSSPSAPSSSSPSRPRSSSSSSASAAGARPPRTPRARRSTGTRASRSSGRRSPRSSSSASRSSSSRDRRPSRRRAASRANELVVEVQGHQFYWQYVYPDGQIAIDTARAPGRPPGEARARLLRRQPQLVGARAHREAGRHPRPDERAPLHADEGGRLRGPLRRALRRPAHRDADDRRGRLAGGLREPSRSSSAARTSRARASSPSAARPGTASAPSATASPARATSGRRWPRAGRSSTRRR